MEDSLGPDGSIAKHISVVVLILVVMEDSLGLLTWTQRCRNLRAVLILVVMEDSLGLKFDDGEIFSVCNVLILVVMEDSLGLVLIAG